LNERLIPDIASAWPNFVVPGPPVDVVSAIEIYDQLPSPSVGDAGLDLSSCVNRALTFLPDTRGSEPSILQVTLAGEPVSASHVRVSFWRRYPDAASGELVASRTISSGGRLHIAGIQRLEGVGELRRSLIKGSRWDRAFVLEYARFDLDAFLDDLVQTKGYADLRFPKIGLVPTVVRLAAARRCCVIRAWYGDTETVVDLFGPSAVINSPVGASSVRFRRGVVPGTRDSIVTAKGRASGPRVRGRMDDAIQMDSDDVSSKWPGKYDDAILEMIDNLPARW
jgi:hypothetical protein